MSIASLREKADLISEKIRKIEQADKLQLEEYRLRYISKKGELMSLFAEMKDIPNESKKEAGQILNELKDLANDKFRHLLDLLESQGGAEESAVDLSLPSIPGQIGSLHPITLVRARYIEIFERMGFNVSDGPEIEDDWHNFTALNFPENHPAREMQDTFFLRKGEETPGYKGDVALRTHTSSIQIRVMENQKPPIRTLAPGRVFRNEAISARANCIFHQMEGLYVNKGVSFKDLKDTLYYFAREMFGQDTKVRFRPSFFPFTEPSAEMDISCQLCKGKGCNICKGSGWVEIGGAGMVDPNVLDNCGIDSKVYSGFAFGFGIERITMLKYQIKDLRLFIENDLRFLSQFRSE